MPHSFHVFVSGIPAFPGLNIIIYVHIALCTCVLVFSKIHFLHSYYRVKQTFKYSPILLPLTFVTYVYVWLWAMLIARFHNILLTPFLPSSIPTYTGVTHNMTTRNWTFLPTCTDSLKHKFWTWKGCCWLMHCIQSVGSGDFLL